VQSTEPFVERDPNLRNFKVQSTEPFVKRDHNLSNFKVQSAEPSSSIKEIKQVIFTKFHLVLAKYF